MYPGSCGEIRVFGGGTVKKVDHYGGYCVTHKNINGDLVQRVSSGGGKKCLDSGYI